MRYELFAFVSLSFFLICFLQQIFDMRKNKTIRIANVFGFMFSATYGFLPAVYVLSYFLHGKSYVRIRYSQERLNDLWIWLALAIVAYFVFRFAYKIKFTSSSSRVDEIPEEKKYDKDDFIRMQITCIASLAIGLVSLYLWTKAYGGVFARIEIANLLRSGLLVINNPLDVFKHSARLLLFTSYASFLLIKKRYQRAINLLIFAVSFVSSILLLLACDGRMSMAKYFVILLLIATDVFGEKIKVGKKFVFLVVIGVASMSVIMKMDSITYYIRNGQSLVNDESMVDSLLSEFGYLLMSGQNATYLWRTDGSPFLIFDDLVSGIFSWLPHSLKPISYVNLWNFNTELCQNADEVRAQIPTDFVSTSLYDLGLLGVVVFGFVFGRIIRGVDQARAKNKNLFYEVFYYSFALVVLRYVNYAWFYDMILYLFYLFVAFVIWKITRVIVNSKRKNR